MHIRIVSEISCNCCYHTLAGLFLNFWIPAFLWLKIIAKLLVLTVKGMRDEQREKSKRARKGSIWCIVSVLSPLKLRVIVVTTLSLVLSSTFCSCIIVVKNYR